MTNSTPDTDASEAELERAWWVLSQSADNSRRVARPIHVLGKSNESWDRKKATDLIHAMRRCGWLRIDDSLKGLRAVYLLRNTEGVLMVTTLTVIKETVEAETSAAPLLPKTSETPKRPPTVREIDGVLYGEVLGKLLAKSFRRAWDGYVPLSACLEKLHGVDLDAERTLSTLIAKGYCSVYVIRGDSLEDASFPCPRQDRARIVVSINDIPVAPPKKHQTSEKLVNGSASYHDPTEVTAPLDWSGMQEKALPSWHPFATLESSREEPVPPPNILPPPISPPKSKPVCAPESPSPRVAHEANGVEDACYQKLRAATCVDRGGLVYGHMSVLAPVFQAHGVSTVGQRRAIVARLIERKLIEPRGKSGITVLGVTGNASPIPKARAAAPPKTSKIDLAYRTLMQQKSKLRTDDGHHFTTHPFDVLSRWPPYIKDHEEARSLLAEMEQLGWIQHIQTGASSYIVLLRP